MAAMGPGQQGGVQTPHPSTFQPDPSMSLEDQAFSRVAASLATMNSKKRVEAAPKMKMLDKILKEAQAVSEEDDEEVEDGKDSI